MKKKHQTLLVVAVIILAIASFSLFISNSQNQVKYDNLVKEYNDVRVNYDCYERGTMDCYERGTYDNLYCYEDPCITETCEAGYHLVCMP